MHESRSSSRSPRARSKVLIAGAAAVSIVAVVVAVLAVMLRHGGSPAPSTPVGSSLEAGASRVFDGYAGSTTCRECHAEQFRSWKDSDHGLAERGLDATLDGRAFATERYFSHGTQGTTVVAGEPFTVRTTGPDGKVGAFTPARVIGNDPLRQFLVAFPGGRYQTLEASYDPARDEWFNVYGEEDRRPGEWGHWTGRGMNWNTMCAACHNVRVRKNYDPATDTFSTAMAERAVGCESCHGPMREHARWRAANRGYQGPEPGAARVNADQMMQTCGSCHARRSDLTGEFVPGDSFHDHYFLGVVDGTEIYFPDGQVREENYEYGAFLGSRMHAKAVRCVDCHEPHSARVRLPGNLMCMSCHAGKEGVPVIDPSSHAMHRLDPLYTAVNGGPDGAGLAARDPEAVARSGGECVNCHMPQTFYMQRHRRHDHGFTIPDPLLTRELGIPNACNRCHTGKDTDWAIAHVNERYGSRMQRPSRERARTMALARRGEAAGRDGAMALLASTTEPEYWRASAAAVLGPWAAEPAVMSALVGATADPGPLVRSHAAQALAPLAGDGAAQPRAALERLLSDPVRSVRFHGERALRATLDEASVAGREFLGILDYVADQPAGRLERGQYRLARSDFAGAVRELEKAVEFDPFSAPLRHDLGMAYAAAGKSDRAVGELEAACGIAPRDAEYRYRLALAYHESARPQDAIEAFGRAVELDPSHARAWYNLGLALDGAGRTEDALGALARAESAAPGDPRAPYAAATILIKQNRTAEAKAAARRALAASPGFTPAIELLTALEDTSRRVPGPR